MQQNGPRRLRFVILRRMLRTLINGGRNVLAQQHKIARVQAWPLRIISDFSWLGVKRENAAPVCFVEVETDTGLKGHGVTQHADPATIAAQVNGVAEKLKGLDALANERVWHVLYWTLSGGAGVQYASWAISAIDVAIWDIKGAVRAPRGKGHAAIAGGRDAGPDARREVEPGMET